MTRGKQAERRKYLASCRQALSEAQSAGDERLISVAMANLGLALFGLRKFEDGLSNFDEAVERAASLGDVKLQAQCLGIKTLAYQEIGRLPDAYETAGEILSLAEEYDDKGMRCDALASQGQILLDSGEPMTAFERFRDARQIAYEIDDKRRQMNVIGALGNYSLAVTSLDRAEAYFEKAAGLARDLEDPQAENGYLGNKAMTLSWQGKYSQAALIFEGVLAFVEESRDREAQIQTLRHLVRVYSELGDDARVIEYGLRGIRLVNETDDEVVYAFLEAMIPAYYRMDRVEEAENVIIVAIEVAQALKDRNKEVDQLLSLGESYMLSSPGTARLNQALDAYRDALEGAREIGRKQDEAYLIGRIGLTLAELGRIDEAIAYHRDALGLARDRQIPELEGEQLIMLAMAYREKGDLEEASAHCRAAIAVYLVAESFDEVENSRKLLAEIDADLSSRPVNEEPLE